MGNTTFPQLIAKRVLTYKTGEFLNSQEYPKLVDTLRGGVILRLPLIYVKKELEKYLDLGFLEDDETLIAYL